MKTTTDTGSGCEKPSAMSNELTCSRSTSLIAENAVEEKNLIRNKPLPIPGVATSKPRVMSYELTYSLSRSLIAQNTVDKIIIKEEKATASTGSGCKQALENELWIHVLTIRLIVSLKYSWIKKIIRIKPLPVPAVVVSKPWAISCEFTCSQSSSMIAQNIVDEKKKNKKKNTADIGSGYEQAMGHELWAFMLTIKLIDSSKYSWRKKYLQRKNHCQYRQWLWASPRQRAVSSHAHNQAHW